MHAIIRRKATVLLGTGLAVVTLGAAAGPDLTSAVSVENGAGYAAVHDRPDGSDIAYARETARIRIHFDSVLAELRAPVARPLTAAQREARAERIATLHAYRDRGVFPHNHEFLDGWMPYFVDHRGVLCAVAFLLESSGRRDIVDRVAAAVNNVWVPQLAADTAFRAWLDASGLTLDEAARIQVPYIGEPAEQQSVATNRTNNTIAAVAGGLGAASIVWSARAKPGEHRALRSAIGLTAGAAGLAIAASRSEARGEALAVGATAGVIGAGSALMGVRALMLGRGEPATAARQAKASNVTVTPAMLANGDGMAPGLTVNLRF